LRVIQDIKQHSTAEILKVSLSVGALQAKLMSRSPDHTSPAVPGSDDVRSDAGLQINSATNAANSNALSSMSGVNGCSISVCNKVNSIVNQPTNSCSYANVNVTSELDANSAGLCESTLPIFSDSTK
jgi:hypothetical protein